MVVMVLRQTTTIRASITAYSTAVGPSSDFRKRCTFKARFFIVPTPNVRAHRASCRVCPTPQGRPSLLPRRGENAAGLPGTGQRLNDWLLASSSSSRSLDPLHKAADRSTLSVARLPRRHEVPAWSLALRPALA